MINETMKSGCLVEQVLSADSLRASYRMATIMIQLAKKDKKTQLNLSNYQLPLLPYGITEWSQLKTLNLSDNQIVDISGLKSLPQLTELTLSNNQIVDISGLKSFPQLTELNLSNNQLVDISVLKSLPRLKTLDLSGNQLVDISVLKSLPQLKTLNLSSNQLVDLSVLKSLPQLTELNLSNNPLVDISVLKSLPQLKTLFLMQLQLTDISVLKGFTQLKILDLSDNSITDISVLKGLTQLTELILSKNQIEHFNLYLTQFTTLYCFEILGNPIKNIPQNVLAGGKEQIRRYQEEKRTQAKTDDPIYASTKSYRAALRRIQNAKTNGNCVLDLGGLNLEIIPSAIQDLNELTHLNLKNNQIADISILKTCPQLETLDLSNNQIKDTFVINQLGLTQLKHLNLQNNKINCFYYWSAMLPALTSCNILGNAVQNTSQEALNNDLQSFSNTLNRMNEQGRKRFLDYLQGKSHLLETNEVL